MRKILRASCLPGPLRRQLLGLYLISAIGSFQMAGAAWVALLVQRGFSLWQIGLMESVFHIVSLLFEIPSGAVADVLGRKRAMVLSRLMSLGSTALMIFSESFWTVTLAIAVNALSYNFVSGTKEALAYDSLKAEAHTRWYERYVSMDTMLWRGSNALATLCAGLSLRLGYRLAYAGDLLINLLCLLLALRLYEAPRRADCTETKDKVQLMPQTAQGLAQPESLAEMRAEMSTALYTGPQVMSQTEPGTVQQTDLHEGAGQLTKNGLLIFVEALAHCFAESFRFLCSHRRERVIILLDSLVGAVATLMLFFLQARLPRAGLPGLWLGPALFVMGLGGVLGARVIRHFSSRSYCQIALLSLGGIAAALLSLLWSSPLLLCAGGFTAAFADLFLNVRTDVELNRNLPSEQRATLISVNSFCFSLIMIGLSPLMSRLF